MKMSRRIISVPASLVVAPATALDNGFVPIWSAADRSDPKGRRRLVRQWRRCTSPVPSRARAARSSGARLVEEVGPVGDPRVM